MPSFQIQYFLNIPYQKNVYACQTLPEMLVLMHCNMQTRFSMLSRVRGQLSVIIHHCWVRLIGFHCSGYPSCKACRYTLAFAYARSEYYCLFILRPFSKDRISKHAGFLYERQFCIDGKLYDTASLNKSRPLCLPKLQKKKIILQVRK